MMLASFLTAAFLVTGISAFRIRNGDGKQAPRLAMKAGLVIAAVLVPVQMFVGDLHGLNTLKNQPAKIAAVEAIWRTEKGAKLLLFALPDEETKTNEFAVGIPKMASLILTHDVNGEIKGLDQFQNTHPPVAASFWSFRLMVGVGLLMLAASWLGLYLLYRKKELPDWMLFFLELMTFSGWIATLAGWYLTEIGRQPWLVTGVLKSADAVTKLPPAHIGFSLFMYLVVYGLLLAAYIHTLRVMARKSIQVEEFNMSEDAVTGTGSPAGGVQT